ncbi:M50 family metallopeptidase [Kordia jejudonensis]|uniref:M50 family metallopeptidase n=1 Tax=Kordia jejudonensis TaxID=1348245 RepID=UPI000628FF0F|nr:M50 family metallopeptidase [Kordia jejudonensis]
MPREYIYTLLFALLAFRMLVIVFHELGHAVASLFHSDGKVSVYIGSYGNPKKSFQFQIKRLEFFVKYNLFAWKGGLCIPHGKKVTWKDRMYISLFGPLTTLTIGIISGILLFVVEKFSLPSILLFALAFSCILDFLFNIIPRRTQIKLHDGTFANNDGKQLVHLWNIRKVYETYNKASNHYVAKEYIKAAELFEKCIDDVSENKEIYRFIISAYIQAKNYQKASVFQEKYTENYDMYFNEHDFVAVGIIEIYKRNYAKALEAFEEVNDLLPNNYLILNNLGYILGLLKRYDEAIDYLDESVLLDESFSYAIDNRGYCKIMLGKLEEGYADLQTALELDDQNSYVYFYLGIYYFKKNAYQKALEYYQKAFELDPETHRIQEYMDEVLEKLQH